MECNGVTTIFNMSNLTIQQLKLLSSAIAQKNDTDAIMKTAVRAVRKIFSADNSWLLYPCVASTPSCRLQYFACRKNMPCFGRIDKTFVVDDALQRFLQQLNQAKKTTTFQSKSCMVFSRRSLSRPCACSQLVMILRMKNDRPWLFGICDRATRHWSQEQIDFFQLVGERVQHSYDTVRLQETVQRDIAKRQKIETEILRSEQRLRSLFQNTSISQWLLDIPGLRQIKGAVGEKVTEQTAKFLNADTPINAVDLWHAAGLVRIVDVNAATLTLFEASDRAYLLSSFQSLLSEKSLLTLQHALGALFSGKKHFSEETDFITLSGKMLAVILNVDVMPSPDSHMVLISVADITARKRIEEELFDSREQYRLLMENSSDAIVLYDAKTFEVIEVNPKAVELTGRSVDKLIGLKQHELHPPEEYGFHKKLFQAHIAGKNDSSATDVTLLHQSGARIPVQISASRTTIKGRTILQRIYHDMRKRVQDEEQRRLLATAVEQAAESVVITDPDGVIEYVNPAYENVTGYSKDEVIGKKAGVVKSGKMEKYQYKLLWETISAGKVWSGKIINRKKDGSLFTEEQTIAPVQDNKGKISHYVAVKRDITRQNQLKNIVRQTQKMQAIGTLAGGIAHDFNNILTAILGFAELSALLCEDNKVLKSNLEEIITASERAGQLIKQILTFSRQTEKNISSLRIDLIVKEALRLLRASLPANIALEIDIRTKEMVRADPTQIHQVVMNLCMNAFQALENENENGKIQVILDVEKVGPRQGVELGNLPSGQYVVLQVKDNGHGIAGEHLDRIFEPYFTTRSKDEGTGLGLSVVHGIVEDHRGALRVESTPGKGSCFYVYLPSAENQVTDSSEVDFTLKTGEGRILLVDDEQQIIDYEVQVLEKAGYVTFSTTSSKEAIGLFQRRKQKIDLIVTDMAMPELTGLQLFDQIRQICKETPVLLCSGYSEHVSAQSAAELGLNGYLAKPFTAEQLLDEVSRILIETKEKVPADC
ncbi:MAG TPA: PAS domain S-box protein [Desulfobulbus sp.]|nr:PAS domain S-box protein [Desulfobulbus sp.]